MEVFRRHDENHAAYQLLGIHTDGKTTNSTGLGAECSLLLALGVASPLTHIIFVRIYKVMRCRGQRLLHFFATFKTHGNPVSDSCMASGMAQEVVLGLGSNLGDRKLYLRRALHLIIPRLLWRAKISSLYESNALLPQGAPNSWDHPYLNLVVSGQTSLSPLELLAEIKKIEVLLERRQKDRWAPREIDIDILAYEKDEFRSLDLILPHPELQNRPFVVLPFLEICPNWKFHNNMTLCEIVRQWEQSGVSLYTKRLNENLVFSELVGIINLTSDSFSTTPETVFQNPIQVCSKIKEFISEGVTIVDIGAESTRPGANPLSAEEEWLRLTSFFETYCSNSELIKKMENEKIFLSLDSRHASNVQKALTTNKIRWINDVTGFSSKKMLETAANSQADLVFMHSVSIPADRSKTIPAECDPIEYLLQWAQNKKNDFKKFGVSENRLIFDPGIGFGKTAEQSLEILRRINEFQKLGLRILVGHSRKSFLNLFTNKPFSDRDPETSQVSVELARKQVHYLRIHNVGINRKALRLASALT